MTRRRGQPRTYTRRTLTRGRKQSRTQREPTQRKGTQRTRRKRTQRNSRRKQDSTLKSVTASAPGAGIPKFAGDLQQARRLQQARLRVPEVKPVARSAPGLAQVYSLLQKVRRSINKHDLKAALPQAALLVTVLSACFIKDENLFCPEGNLPDDARFRRPFAPAPSHDWRARLVDKTVLAAAAALAPGHDSIVRHYPHLLAPPNQDAAGVLK